MLKGATANLGGFTKAYKKSLCISWHGEGGRPYEEVKRSFNSAVRRAGIKDFTFHDLRHTFASHLVMAGVDLTTVKELLGHKTLIMALRYAHLAPSHKIKAVGMLDDALNEKNQLYKNYII